MSCFWKTIHSLTGVKLKMSTSYHPETDSSSEHTNKMVIQCIHYAVEWDQKGWVKALPKIRFDILNTVNRSTGFTPFQLHFGHSPQLLPPLFPSTQKTPTEQLAIELLTRMTATISKAQDNLISAKVSQVFQANKKHSLTFPFRIGDKVILLMLHHHREFRAGDSNRIAKFMPHFNGPFLIKDTDKKHSTVTLS